MKILLDTQVALWAWSAPDQLAEWLKSEIASSRNEVYFSQVSTWEIQIKFSLGKLRLPDRPERLIPVALEKSGFNYWMLQDAAIFFLDRLPHIHRDPFDRLLIAHAITGGFHVATIDPVVRQYPVQLVG